MNGNMNRMYQTEMNFLKRKNVCKLSRLMFLLETAIKFRNLQISNILNTDANRIFSFQGYVYIFEIYIAWKTIL